MTCKSWYVLHWDMDLGTLFQGFRLYIASLETLCVRQDGGTSFACTIEERPLAQVVGNGGSGAGRNGGNPFLSARLTSKSAEL